MSWEGPSLIEYISTHNAKRVIDGVQFSGVVSITVIYGTDIVNQVYAYPIIFVLLVSVIIDFIGYKYRNRYRLSQRIEARLLALNRLLNYPDGYNVRFTYHRVISRRFRKNMFVMDMDLICNYNEQRSGGGRFFSIDKGVIGEAYDTQDTVVYNCYSRDDCMNKLTEGQNYSREEATEHVHKRSYLGYPIVDPAKSKNKVHGVVFFESQAPNTFPQREDENKLPDSRERDRAQVNGFAVNAGSVSGSSDDPVELDLYGGEIYRRSANSLPKNGALSVSSGEVLPENANAVVSENNTIENDQKVVVHSNVGRGDNVDTNTKKIISTCRDIKSDVLSAPFW